MPDWSIETEKDLNRLVRIGATTESLHLDFKSALDHRPTAQAELGRDISQFANTFGGCLLIGVEEENNPQTNIKTARRILGVANPERCREAIEQRAQNSLIPSDFTKPIHFIQTTSTSDPTQRVTVIAVNVPASRRLIWTRPPGSHHLEAVYRTNHGKNYMTPTEIEQRWSNTPRAAQISFHDAKKQLRVLQPSGPLPTEIVGGVITVVPHMSGGLTARCSVMSQIDTDDANGFSLRLTIGQFSHILRVPFELLNTAWVDNSKIHILPRAQIFQDPSTGDIGFDPFKGPI